MKTAKVVLVDIRENFKPLEIEPLPQSMTDEVTSGNYLAGDHMNKFGEILFSKTDFDQQNVFFIGVLQFVKKVELSSPHIQILSSSNPQNINSITHWICTYYDGNKDDDGGKVFSTT